jgi:hypothetical protein
LHGLVVDEDAPRLARQELREEEHVGVDDGAPSPADAPARREVAGRVDVAEDVGEHVIR